MKKTENQVPNMFDLLTMEEGMERLGVARTTMIVRIKEGRFHPIKRDGRLYFTPQEIDAEIERRLASNKILARPRTLARPRAAAGKTVAIPMDPGVPRHTAEEAAASVRLFEQGKGVRDAVRDLKISYEAAHYLSRQFAESGPEFLLKREDLRAIRDLLGWHGGEVTAATFLTAIERALDKAATSVLATSPDEINAMVEDAREEGYDSGYAEGLADGRKAMQEELAKTPNNRVSAIRQEPKPGPIVVSQADPTAALSDTVRTLMKLLDRERPKAK
jgi:Helix-turn-helix domain